MNITIEPATLAALINRALGAVAERSTIPEVMGVFLDANDDELTVMGTDLIIGLVQRGPCEVKKPGKVVVGAKLLAERIGTFSEAITMTAEKGKLTLKSGARKHVLSTLNADAFPRTSLMAEQPIFECPSNLVRDALVFCAPAMADQVERPQLNGIAVKMRGGLVQFAAADGHRVHIRKFAATVNDDTFTGILPFRAVKTLAKLCSDMGIEPVKFGRASASAVVAEVGNIAMSIKLVDGKVMPFEEFVPAEQEEPASFSRAAMLDAIRSARLSVGKTDDGVRFTAEKGSFRITAESADGVASEDYLAAEGATGDFKLSAKYLSDLVGVLDESCTLHVKGSLDPILVRDSDPNTLGVIMPQKLT